MLLASVLKKLLWVAGYPSFPSEMLGPFPVGACQTRIPGSTGCQIHYPAVEEPSFFRRRRSPHYPYFRERAVEGVADYSRTNPALLRFLSAKTHPCLMGADPIEDARFPIVVFSHGLGGCMEMYTQFCQQIASCGFWVIALEHEDGSGAFAETESGETIPYKRPDDSPYCRDKVLNFRRPFLKQRVQEITKTLEYILAFSNEKNDDMEEHVQKVLRAADKTKGVSLTGHSFGGASMVLAAQEYHSKPDSSIQPTSVSVLDPWAFSLEDEALQEGVRSIPTLSILSESWVTNPEVAQVKQLLEGSEKVTSLYAPGSVHASFADSVSWIPGFALRKMHMRGAKEKRHETIRSVTKTCVEHIQNSMKSCEKTPTVNDYLPLQPFHIPIGEQVQAETVASAERSEEPVRSRAAFL